MTKQEKLIVRDILLSVVIGIAFLVVIGGCSPAKPDLLLPGPGMGTPTVRPPTVVPTVTLPVPSYDALAAFVRAVEAHPVWNGTRLDVIDAAAGSRVVVISVDVELGRKLNEAEAQRFYVNWMWFLANEMVERLPGYDLRMLLIAEVDGEGPSGTVTYYEMELVVQISPADMRALLAIPVPDRKQDVQSYFNYAGYLLSRWNVQVVNDALSQPSQADWRGAAAPTPTSTAVPTPTKAP